MRTEHMELAIQPQRSHNWASSHSDWTSNVAAVNMANSSPSERKGRPPVRLPPDLLEQLPPPPRTATSKLYTYSITRSTSAPISIASSTSPLGEMNSRQLELEVNRAQPASTAAAAAKKTVAIRTSLLPQCRVSAKILQEIQNHEKTLAAARMIESKAANRKKAVQLELAEMQASRTPQEGT